MGQLSVFFRYNANHNQSDKPRLLRVDLTQGESYREVKIRELYKLKS